MNFKGKPLLPLSINTNIGFYQKFLFFVCLLFLSNILMAQKSDLSPLRVSADGHFMEKENGEPFFWLGDTAWRLFANLDSTEIKQYFKQRKEQGFNVIQCSLLHGGIQEKNAYGEMAFHEKNLDKPNEKFWKNIDYVLQKGTESGFYMAILPAWGRTYTETLPKDSAIVKVFEFDTVGVYKFGKFVGNRYKNYKNIIWVLGGDAYAKRHPIYENLAKGITEMFADGDAKKTMLTYHPNGGTYRPPATSSGEFYHEKSWMDFNMIQSGHRIGNRNFERIFEDYNRIPAKPTIDAEPCYEKHPNIHDYKNGELNDWHVRNRGYWSVLAGAFGYTYGATGIYDMSKPERKGKMSHFKDYWYVAMNYEGANDMIHLKNLFESRPFISPARVPDQSLVLNQSASWESHVQVARAADFGYIIAYMTNGTEAKLDIFKNNSFAYKAWWFNPRDGKTYNNEGKLTTKPFATIKKSSQVPTFNPPANPAEGNDWVLVLDKVGSKYGMPSQKK
jgi:Protein of unknown function (DUF4038)/Putative collagen-binding domain of a collagenase